MPNQKWIDCFTKDMGSGGFPDIVKRRTEEGLFHLWERTSPPGMSDSYLAYAIDISCSEFNHEYRTLFLDWSIAHSERALVDPRFKIESDNQLVGWLNETYLVKHSQTLQINALAIAMRDNADINHAQYLQAADELHQHVLNESKFNWELRDQTEYLNVIHMKLIADDVVGAQAMFKTRKKFKFAQRHFDLLHAFTFAIPLESDKRITDLSVIENFTNYFNLVRDLDYRFSRDRERDGNAYSGSMSFIRLDLALLMHKYIHGKPIENNWEHIFSSISA